jgi:DNA-binding transcriptional ArsR family regulator
MVLLTLRMFEHWRLAAGDRNRALVLLAVVAVSSERLTRVELPEAQRDLRVPVDEQVLSSCNISSIAAATGLNRETARRHVNGLVEQGLLVREEDGSVRLVPGFVQAPEQLALLASELEAFTKTANDLLRDGTLQIEGG